MPTMDWQKSSYSNQGANCLYIARTSDGTIRLRESDDPDVILRTTPAALRAFLQALKAGADRS
ncbi:DUF397 domain-containing protein [Streptomyces sp. So13.3]|uniref:DUF397 domain-containing protein n=1 Tax=Streptomyces TaxID=1883 RepID=UPI001106DC58|nr:MULTISPECIES: DUF397 domain-containing protein [Streptomyces]MCZ4095752.1 DUF397 domain-containing protein [Streptomyces sp. H39-C1]QNA73791.1 DUF397 domain-containing protein [Streptomyces sp. So13.3]